MHQIQSIIESNGTGVVIAVECRISNSLPAIVIVGVAHRSVDEAKERIRGALASSNIALPRKRITINLAPADIPKEGSGFDLPILIAILSAAGLTVVHPGPNTIVIGEVGLDGKIHPVRGIIGKIMAAQMCGITNFWIAEGNRAQAQLIPGITLHTFTTVSELYVQLAHDALQPPLARVQQLPAQVDHLHSFAAVAGQERAKRALIIAAAGHHNSILCGPPGSGKSMLANALPSIMPTMSRSELLSVTHLHSLTTQNFDTIVTTRPFRAPHHGSSRTTILGGGVPLRPGEISLSSHGVLFFDEFMEFSRTVIESLRQPLEQKSIRITRGKQSAEFPAHILFIAATNPCPCGFYGSITPCVCTLGQIARYNKKLTGPILDRIDLFIDVAEIKYETLLPSTPPTQPDTAPADTVNRVRVVQQKRAGKLNSELSNLELKQTARLRPAAKALLGKAAPQLQLSARGYIRAVRVARTIADIEDSMYIEPQHMGEALQYRRKLPSG